MNQLFIIFLTLLSLTFAIIGLSKDSDKPMYLKIEVQYGK